MTELLLMVGVLLALALGVIVTYQVVKSAVRDGILEADQRRLERADSTEGETARLRKEAAGVGLRLERVEGATDKYVLRDNDGKPWETGTLRDMADILRR